ncbi:LacI family DNA-binding transcriptional regulator [Glaciecola sp. MH2013]|uniref:LacI family DNA-binding transcriptional regulator n=1 Tax=Glaciecola sp. MH2013 TaxID=2785524 RepID=UPI00189FD093|nr:LacI family DNA-binding transcriptional regulator [Glaciecola sp. MH2013]MBF7073857.1 LacI family DNA-binding transcriptional regulator [Glaciecola sp. MH2013]
MSKIGIKDIASQSGVSSATVSRTLRSPELVSEDTRKRVLEAIKATGYKPNRFGASLRTQKSGNVVVVMPDITNQVNAGIIRAIESEAHKAGYCVLLGDTQNQEEREQHYADMVTSGQADGILIFTPNLPFSLKTDKPISEQLPPLVNSCEEIANDDIYKVVIDNKAGARTAVQHLLDLGHTCIAAVMGPKDTPSTLDRLAGYKQALTEANIEINRNLIIRGDYRTESGIEAMEKLLRLRHRPTAVFCFSDDMAIGAMNTLREYDYRIPQDISVIGFDDISYSKLMYPKLTTIRQPLEDIGRNCMRVLLEQLRGNKPAQKITELPFELVVRQSTGPVPR